VEAGILTSMGRTKKITVEVPADLLKKAQKATGEGVTQTVRQGLEKIVGADVYERLIAARGTVHLTYDIDELRQDRD
jgi:hypothetical protein